MANVLKKLENALELKGGLNGLKLILGCALIVFSHQLAMVNELMLQLPDATILGQVAGYLAIGIAWLSKVLGVFGSGLSGIGFLDKIRKFIFGASEK